MGLIICTTIKSREQSIELVCENYPPALTSNQQIKVDYSKPEIKFSPPKPLFNDVLEISPLPFTQEEIEGEPCDEIQSLLQIEHVQVEVTKQSQQQVTAQTIPTYTQTSLQYQSTGQDSVRGILQSTKFPKKTKHLQGSSISVNLQTKSVRFKTNAYQRKDKF